MQSRILPIITDHQKLNKPCSNLEKERILPSGAMSAALVYTTDMLSSGSVHAHAE